MRIWGIEDVTGHSEPSMWATVDRQSTQIHGIPGSAMAVTRSFLREWEVLRGIFRC
jgi:hypothetical protein